MPSTLMMYEREVLSKKDPRVKAYDKKIGKSRKKSDVEKARDMLRKMGESGPEIRRQQQMKRNKGLILADEEEITTEPGAVDDDAKERIKRRKKRLEEAAG
jgi:hypothetical protein